MSSYIQDSLVNFQDRTMVDFAKLQIKVLEETDTFGRYEIGPVAKGFGQTIANPLRRTLLSSVEGSGITSIKIAGVKHEFSSLKGLSEDILQVVLRVKGLRLACHSDEPQVLRLSVKGPGEVTAKDLEENSSVEIINPKHVIATLADDKSKLDMEITVERGIGYKLADDSLRKKIGMIPMDANFSPVKRVKFEVVDTRVGQRTDFDKVIMEVYTDGTVKSGDCMTQATETLVKVYAKLAGESEAVKKILETKGAEEVIEAEVEEVPTDISIEEIDLPVRALNSLRNAGITSTSQLEEMTAKDAEAIEGLGKKSIEDIEKALAKQGLGFIE